MKKFLKRPLSMSLTCLSLLATSLPSQAVESIQLEHVPIDATWGCERVFFKSSQNFTGTIYALPVVIPATDEYGETIMTTDVDANRGYDNFLLNFQLYFPNDDKAMRDKTPPSIAPTLPKCDFEVVKSSLNVNLPENQKIHTISYMPLTSIEVTIPEYLDESFLIGQKKDAAEADLIAYQGATFNITMRMNKTEKAAILNALTRKEGLQARVRMRFKAHKQNGAIKVDLDMSQLAASFKLAAKGKVYMVEADVQAALKMAISEQSQSIQIQEGISESFNSLVGQVMNKVLEEVKLVPEAVVEDREATAKDVKGKKISVAAVADVISKKVTSNFSVINSSAAEVATAEVIVPLQATLNDPNIRVMRVASGEALEPTLSEEIREGDTFTITGSHYVLETLAYKEQASFVTSADLRTNYVELTPIATLLADRDFNVELVVRNGVSLASGSWDWLPHIFAIGTEVTWMRIERLPELIRNPRVRLENDQFSYDRFPVYATFSQVGGQRKMFRFSDLMSSNDYWEGRYDEQTGSIVVTAKQNLGLMALRPRFKLNENNDRLDYAPELQEKCDALNGRKKMECYFADRECDKLPSDEMYNCWDVDHRRITVKVEELVQMQTGMFGGTEETRYTIRTDNKATVNQRVIYYNITLPRYENMYQ